MTSRVLRGLLPLVATSGLAFAAAAQATEAAHTSVSMRGEIERLARAAVDSLRAHGVATPRGVLVITMGEGGGNPGFNVWDAVLTEEQRRSLMPIARDFINRRGSSQALQLAVRLDRIPAEVPQGTLMPASFPAHRRLGAVQEYMRRIMVADARTDRAAHTVALDVWVGADGRPVAAYLLRWSGEEHIDEFVMGLADRLQFTPATAAAGQPTPCWTQFTLTFDMR